MSSIWVRRMGKTNLMTLFKVEEKFIWVRTMVKLNFSLVEYKVRLFGQGSNSPQIAWWSTLMVNETLVKCSSDGKHPFGQKGLS